MDLKMLGLVFAAVLALAGAGYAAGFFGHAPPPFANVSWNGTHSGWNGTAFNATAAQDFRQAVASGDYNAAMSLHQEYGFGGKLFGKLN